MQKWKLIGSAGSLDTLARGIKEYYCTPPLLELQNDGTYSVSTGSGPITGVRIIYERGRYRFERQEEVKQCKEHSDCGLNLETTP